MLRIDPAAGTTELIGDDLKAHGNDKWYGIAAAADGKLYCAPCNASRVLRLRTSADDAAYAAVGASPHLARLLPWLAGAAAAFRADPDAALLAPRRFYFVPRDAVLAARAPLPRMQDLLHDGRLVGIDVDVAASFERAAGAASEFVFVSHRWEDASRPDSEGVQLGAVQDYLRDHADVRYVWFDYWCMFQRKSAAEDDRSAAQKAEFDRMLASIADLYLTMRVLILVDLNYMGRFWTSLEAWCAMQQVIAC